MKKKLRKQNSEDRIAEGRKNWQNSRKSTVNSYVILRMSSVLCTMFLPRSANFGKKTKSSKYLCQSMLIRVEKNLKFLVANGFSVDIIVDMNVKRTVCSTFTAIISLSLLLRR